jgi:hypothetical protein
LFFSLYSSSESISIYSSCLVVDFGLTLLLSLVCFFVVFFVEDFEALLSFVTIDFFVSLLSLVVLGDFVTFFGSSFFGSSFFVVALLGLSLKFESTD